jgi:hypothetical protein
VQVVGVLMRRVHRLVAEQPHLLERNVDGLIDLLWRRLFALRASSGCNGPPNLCSAAPPSPARPSPSAGRAASRKGTPACRCAVPSHPSPALRCTTGAGSAKVGVEPVRPRAERRALPPQLLNTVRSRRIASPATASARFGTGPRAEARTTPCRATSSTGSKATIGQSRARWNFSSSALAKAITDSFSVTRASAAAGRAT